MIKKLLVPLILGMLVSFFFFPISFTFLPASLNTKQMLAVWGGLCFVWGGLKSKKMYFSREVFWSACLAALFSFSCYISIVYNNTNDKSYVSYIVSYFVWLAGAYGLCSFFKLKFGFVTIQKITKYLMWVCVAQCIAALLNDNVPAFKDAVCLVVNQGADFLDGIDRMYGIGAALDPAGVRFSIVLVLVAHSLCSTIFERGNTGEMFSTIFAFFFIILVGNMISRTTTVGGVMGLAYILFYLGRVENGVISKSSIKLFLTILSFLVIAVPIVIYLYDTSPNMHSNLRFAFEGFFNWVETGEWRTDSTDKLNAVMWVWPEDFQTWMIGSGLFANWTYSTDIGYCRFVLYCGVVGFSIFSLFFIYNASAFAKKFTGVSLLAFCLLALTFVIWIKVATDIFQIYALLFCAEATFDYELEPEEELIS